MMVIDVVQYGQGPQGPGGLYALFQQYFLLVVLLIAVPLLIIAYRLLFPNLNSVRATQSLRPVAASKGPRDAVELSEPPGPRVEAPPDALAPADAEATFPDAVGLALRLLQADERKVVEALMNAEGSMLQKNITHETGFSRVKTHRVLVRLLRRNVVVSEKYYNTNRITLTPWILEKL